MRLLIKYRSSADEITNRVISDIKIESDKSIDAYCHLRKSRRSFVLKRIEEAKDIETGELIHDIGMYLGLKPIKLPPPSLPKFTEIPLKLSLGEASRRRKEDKWALFKTFKYPEIADVYNKKLWALFDNQCFNCGTNKMLELDHHIPQSLGGRLVPYLLSLGVEAQKAEALARAISSS